MSKVILSEEVQLVIEKLHTIEKELSKERMNADNQILDTEGVMNLLKVSRRSLQNWRDQGLLEYSAVNGKYYYRMSAINKMLDSKLINSKNVMV